MNQTAVLAVSIAFALASYVPLFTSAVSSSLIQKLTQRETQTRFRLSGSAIEQLKDLRVRLDEFFEEYDKGEDQYLRRARPRDLQGPVAEYLRLLSLQDKMDSALAAVQRLSRVAFWFLLAFSFSITVTVVLGFIARLIGLEWSLRTLLLSGVVFAIGGSLYVLILIFARRVDAAHAVARRLEGNDVVELGEFE